MAGTGSNMESDEMKEIKDEELDIKHQEKEKTGKTGIMAEGSILREAILLLIKIGAVIAAFAIVFVFIFGIYRSRGEAMYPMLKDGDLVIYFRFDKDYVADELAVVEYQGERQTRRVVAVAGDTVDIDTEQNKLILNGAVQQEIDIHEPTLRYDTGVDFPLTVGEGQIFVLGDSREKATDSRVYGCVNVNDTLGKAIWLLRTRGL